MSEKIKIFVDDREDEKSVEALKNIEELEVEVKRLDIGDVICESKGICIERKSMNDFFTSIRGHLQDQCLNMIDNYKSRYIILIGGTKQLRNGFNSVPQGAAINMVIGAIASFSTKYNTPVLWVENNSQYAYLVHKICEKEGEPIGHDLVRRETSVEDRYLCMLMSSIEGLGKKKATVLSQRFKNLSSIRSALDSDILALDGFGKVMLENIRKAQVFW